MAGAFIRKGWAMAQKACPIRTYAKPTLMKHRIPEPKAVNTAPTIMPFLMPLTSSIQLQGKLTKMYMMRYRRETRETKLSETLYVWAAFLSTVERVTQQAPLMKRGMEKSATITNR